MRFLAAARRAFSSTSTSTSTVRQGGLSTNTKGRFLTRMHTNQMFNVARAFQPELPTAKHSAGECFRARARARVRKAADKPIMNANHRFYVARAFQPEHPAGRFLAAAKRGVFKYEYEYRPPGRTESEYERTVFNTNERQADVQCSLGFPARAHQPRRHRWP
jgi:hypothetical protein